MRPALGAPEPPLPQRLRALIAFDRSVAEGICVAGFDEAGRGAWAGPIVVGCVSFDPGSFLTPDGRVHPQTAATLAALDDSKRVSERRREQLFHAITALARWSVGCASACEIDRIGIVPACRQAADRAWRRLETEAELLLLDRGISVSPRTGRTPPLRSLEITHGDGTSMHIAAASIVAKVWRDQRMRHLATRAAGYGLERHKGYGTAGHRQALTALGPSRLHRETFLGGRGNAVMGGSGKAGRRGRGDG
jgi:ribonuclease HII